MKLHMHVICFCICSCLCFSLKINKLQQKHKYKTLKYETYYHKSKSYIVCSEKTAILQISVAIVSVIVFVHKDPHLPFLTTTALSELPSGPSTNRTLSTV